MSGTILIVDDESKIRTSLQGILEDESYLVMQAVDGHDALATLQRELPDIVLLDIWMPGIDGLETLARIKDLYPELVVVMISGHGTIETAVKATKLGAYDFIEKPLSLDKVLLTVHNAIGMLRLRQENASLRSLIDEKYEFIGTSITASQLREHIRVVARTSAPILISGERGTGKESVAHEIHRYSARSEKPFLVINCAGVPEELIESEIFGHEKGAFPGANSQRKGIFDMADGGTLFLEEIFELPMHLQVRLLRVIEEQTFERMGGAKQHSTDIRIMVSTSHNLDNLVKSNQFNEQLFFVLNVVPFELLPLRDRKEDIPALIEHFLDLFCKRELRERKIIHPDTVAAMQCYDWPGNIRELKNIMERLVIMSVSDTITQDQLPDIILEKWRAGQELKREDDNASLRGAREEFERQFIIQKLEEYDWNITRTAEAIGLERSNLHRKIRSYSIELKK